MLFHTLWLTYIQACWFIWPINHVRKTNLVPESCYLYDIYGKEKVQDVLLSGTVFHLFVEDVLAECCRQIKCISGLRLVQAFLALIKSCVSHALSHKDRHNCGHASPNMKG